MNAMILIGVMTCSFAGEDKLVERLDADFETLVANDANRVQLRQAARLLEGTNVHSGWGFFEAVKIVRQTRCKAGIPLLMKNMIQSAAGKGNAHIAIPEFADTITILTGKGFDSPYRGGRDPQTAVRAAILELADKWWTPHQGEITTNLDKMTAEQLEVVVNRLLKKASRDHYLDDRSGRQEVTAYRFYHIITYRIVQPHSSSERALWYPEELRAAMVRPLLDRAGYVKDPAAETGQTRGRIPYAAIGLLADLRKNQEAGELPKVADDARQNAATRLTCTLALLAAGEELKTPVLLSILDTEKDLENRLVATLALQYSRERVRAGAKLVELLDDPNREVRVAATCALRGPRPGQALPKLKTFVDELGSKDAYGFVFDTLAAYKTKEACEILVGFIRAALEDSDKERHVFSAYHALETATGQRWSGAGAQTPEYWRQKARDAVKWWDSEGKHQDLNDAQGPARKRFRPVTDPYGG
jgi:hypothetical protein